MEHSFDLFGMCERDARDISEKWSDCVMIECDVSVSECVAYARVYTHLYRFETSICCAHVCVRISKRTRANIRVNCASVYVKKLFFSSFMFVCVCQIHEKKSYDIEPLHSPSNTHIQRHQHRDLFVCDHMTARHIHENIIRYLSVAKKKAAQRAKEKERRAR